MVSRRCAALTVACACVVVFAAHSQVTWPEQVRPTLVVRAEGDLSVFVTGWLPPIADGLDPCPDGILVDLPEGMTFEYRGGDIRLLGVRDGRLKDAEPTGPVWYLRNGGSPGPTFRLERSAGVEDLVAKRPAMRIGWYYPPAVQEYVLHEHREYGEPVVQVREFPPRQMPVLSYRLERSDGAVVARVEESLRSVSTTSARGFVRRFVIRRENDEEMLPLQLSLDVRVLGEPAGPDVVWPISSGPPRDSDWRLDTLGRDWGHVRRNGDQLTLVVLSRPPGMSERDGRLVLDVRKGELFRLEVATFVLPEWKDGAYRELEKALRGRRY